MLSIVDSVLVPAVVFGGVLSGASETFLVGVLTVASADVSADVLEEVPVTGLLITGVVLAEVLPDEGTVFDLAASALVKGLT